MERNVKNSWQVRLAALVVFLLGFAAGALALSAYRSWARPTPTRESRRDRFEQVIQRLELTDEQEPQVRQIFADARERVRALREETEPRFDEVRRQTDERLQKVLTPEQWERFQKMMSESRGQGRGRRERGGGSSDGR
jgi:Spy/CpxP family protein refolding chaperone